MATYQDPNYLTQITNVAFDPTHPPGTATPYSGIYRCMGCGRELVSEAHKPMPPQNHHQHTPQQGAIAWKLITYADHEPKH